MAHTTSINEKLDDHKCKCSNREYNDTVDYVKDYCEKIRLHHVSEYRRKLHQEFSDSITLHGYRQVANETGWRRVSWILVMTILTSFAVYLFYQMLLDFGHKTVLEYELQDGGKDLKFPTITICTNSPAFTKTTYKNFPLNISMKEFKKFYLEELSSVNYQFNTSAESAKIIKQLALLNISGYKSILELFDNTIEDTSDVWKRFTDGPTCYLGNRPCNFSKDFKETLHWKFSLCHQWNYYDSKDTAKKQTASDETLTMLLNIHAGYKLVSYYPFYGLVLYIHPYGTPHHLASHTDSIGLQSGMFTTVDIGLTEVIPFNYNSFVMFLRFYKFSNLWQFCYLFPPPLNPTFSIYSNILSASPSHLPASPVSPFFSSRPSVYHLTISSSMTCPSPTMYPLDSCPSLISPDFTVSHFFPYISDSTWLPQSLLCGICLSSSPA